MRSRPIAESIAAYKRLEALRRSFVLDFGDQDRRMRTSKNPDLAASLLSR